MYSTFAGTDTHARTANKWWVLGTVVLFSVRGHLKISSENLGCQTFLPKGASRCSYRSATNTHSVTVSLPFNLIHSLSLSFSHTRCTNVPISLKTWIFETEASEIFHNLPQTSSNLSFSLQWSNGDVCSSLVQLNFKKLYTHAEYHYCKRNYHKVSLPSVAPLSLCMIILTYSVAGIHSVSRQKGVW